MTVPDTKILSLADVRPGDICLTTMSGLIPGWLPVRIGQWLCKQTFRIGPFTADHVLVCVEAAEPTTYARLRIRVQDEEVLVVDKEGIRIPHASPRAVQAMPRGAEEIALSPAKHWGARAVWFRLAEDYPGQAEDAAAIARLFVSEKVPYSFLSYPAIAAWSRGLKVEWLERWIGRRREPSPAMKRRGPWPGQLYTPRLPEEAICSVLADQAWTLAGKHIMQDTAHQAVTPGALGMVLNAIAVADSL